jgi:hypothetical protein
MLRVLLFVSHQNQESVLNTHRACLVSLPSKLGSSHTRTVAHTSGVITSPHNIFMGCGTAHDTSGNPVNAIKGACLAASRHAVAWVSWGHRRSNATHELHGASGGSNKLRRIVERFPSAAHSTLAMLSVCCVVYAPFKSPASMPLKGIIRPPPFKCPAGSSVLISCT